MQCDECREILSAALDGEAERAVPEVEDHLAGCPACTAWEQEAAALHRSVRVRPAERVPDLTAAILAAHLGAEPTWRQWPRYALLAIGLTHLVLAVPGLVLGSEPHATVHIAHELGAWDVALAVGLLVAAWQPRRAAGLLPMALALGIALAFTGTLDVAAGRAAAAGEAHHLLDLAGVVLLWCLARPDGTPLLPLVGRDASSSLRSAA
jgi:predicted anti-sigma-YlaC factor YlaD